MSMPSPFELGGAIGGNVSKGINDYLDASEIDKILSKAKKSEDPYAIEDALRTVQKKVSSRNQPQAIENLKLLDKRIKESNSQKAYRNVADQLEEAEPRSSMNAILASIYRSTLPTDEKAKVVKTITAATPFKLEQQQRLKEDSTLRKYNTRIKEIDNQLKDFNTEKKEREKLLDLRNKLINERDQLLNFKALQDAPKPKYDPNNPAHLEIKKQVENSVGHDPDRSKSTAKLLEIFDV